ncbi:UNKNOWN [Stylonychia lemnae]|uniref:Uncharacterized protein n=1 Tax=Stylonychia lemnae TaxID=5949 RepID=A0A077ZZQ7_STYLE|nr:UNKNOWN [Stylonychia lemnae]|eukprot:CDW74008.1 UNKNOWN [Stylonychia lemnae]
MESNKPIVKSHQAPGGNSNFSLGWEEPVVNKQPVQRVGQNPYAHEEPVAQQRVQKQYVNQSPWASHDEQPSFQQQKQRVEQRPFATDDSQSNNESNQYGNRAGRKVFQQQQDAPWANHDNVQFNQPRQEPVINQPKNAPFATYGGQSTENTQPKVNFRVNQAPGGTSNFSLSDGSQGSDRFQTSNQKANSQMENRIGQAFIGKLNNNQNQVAGFKQPLGQQNGQHVFSQITF